MPYNKIQTFLAASGQLEKKYETHPEKPTYTVLVQPKNTQNQIWKRTNQSRGTKLQNTQD